MLVKWCRGPEPARGWREGRRRELLCQLLRDVEAAAAGRWQRGLRHGSGMEQLGFPARRVLPALSNAQRHPRESRDALCSQERLPRGVFGESICSRSSPVQGGAGLNCQPFPGDGGDRGLHGVSSSPSCLLGEDKQGVVG